MVGIPYLYKTYWPKQHQVVGTCPVEGCDQEFTQDAHVEDPFKALDQQYAAHWSERHACSWKSEAPNEHCTNLATTAFWDGASIKPRLICGFHEEAAANAPGWSYA